MFLAKRNLLFNLISFSMRSIVLILLAVFTGTIVYGQAENNEYKKLILSDQNDVFSSIALNPADNAVIAIHGMQACPLFIYNWKEENVALAHAWCKRKCERFMKINMNRVIVANTSVTEWEITPYLNLAKKYGYTVFSIIVENRHGNSSIHNVPIETLERMKSKFDICL